MSALVEQYKPALYSWTFSNRFSLLQRTSNYTKPPEEWQALWLGNHWTWCGLAGVEGVDANARHGHSHTHMMDIVNIMGVVDMIFIAEVVEFPR